MPDKSGWMIWLTGRPASGKTTLAHALRNALRAASSDNIILDSDELRPVLTPYPTYTEAERDRFYAGLVDLAALLTRYGVNVIIAATGSRRAYREAAQKKISDFAEVWVRCSVEVCRERDPKGLYARAEAGEITSLPGVSTPYEPPERPAVTVDTDQQSPEAITNQILAEVAFLAHNESADAGNENSDQ